jgi:hypothetical protein
LPSRARLVLAGQVALGGRLGGVGDQLPVDHIGQSPAQAPQGLQRSLSFGELAPVVGAAGGVVADLHDGGDVEHVVEPPVAGAGEPVADLLAGGRVDGGGAGPGGEVVAVGEAGHVTNVSQDAGGAGWADPVDVHQSGARGGDRLSQPPLERLEFAVEGLDLGDQLGRHRPAGPSGHVPRADRSEQRPRLQGRQMPGCASGDQFGQQPVQLVQ